MTNKTFGQRLSLLAPMLALLVFTTACSSGDDMNDAPITPTTPLGSPKSIVFDTYIQSGNTQTRATYPNDTYVGQINLDRLKVTSFGVFAQSTGNTTWSGYPKTTPYNFMWNQKVEWSDPNWTYTPVKYWPNDNTPADDKGAQGSVAHSYLSFFAYAPYVEAAELPGREDDAADGIIEMTANSANIDASYLYYRTSNDNPYGVDESIDLLWATTQDCYKYDATSDDNDQGRVGDRVQLNFKHALAKLSIYTQLYVDRTADLSSDAYPTELDSNTKIFIDNVTINTPSYYPEGMLVFGPNQTTPKWDYTGLSAKAKTSFRFDSDTDNDVDDVRYAIRYAAPNIPASATITDANSDGIDDVTGLTEAETVKEAFDAMETGVTASEQQLSATHEVFLFPPSEEKQAISVTAVYHVVTYDASLTLNEPKYYSNVTNNITASLGNNDFMFEPNKQYKILLSLGITSVKFDIYVLNDSGEYILLSAVVKEWDQSTTEVNVE